VNDERTAHESETVTAAIIQARTVEFTQQLRILELQPKCQWRSSCRA